MSVRKVIHCCVCGKTYTQNDRRDRMTCLDCKQKARHEKRRQKESTERRNAFALTIVSDPLETGGFGQGTYFDQTAVMHMLQAKSFTPGTRVRNSRGQEFEYHENYRRFLPAGTLTSL